MTDARDRDTREILNALIVTSRRGVADSRSGLTALTPTAQSIVAYIVDNPGSRSTDIAREFHLNRSTISRQLADLVRMGIVRESSIATGRGRPLELTDDGWNAFRETFAVLQDAVGTSIESWTDAEVARFAADLSRFVAASGSPRERQRRQGDPAGEEKA